MEGKEKEIIDKEDHEEIPTENPPKPEPQSRFVNEKRTLDNDLTRYGANEYLETTEVEDEKRFDKVIGVNTFKQWAFTIFTVIIIALAIADIGFGIGKLDNWVYLFGVLTAYEANEAREKKVITKEYKETRRNTRNIVISAINFKNRVD